MKVVYRNIEAERVRNGLTKLALSKTLGIYVKTYDNWIMRKTEMPAIKLYEMAALFGVSSDYLLEQTNVNANATL